MIKHHLILFLRNIKKDKSTFLINLIGLSTGLACVLLIYLWVNDELNVDTFHENDERLYQVVQNNDNGQEIQTSPYTPNPLATALTEEMPEVELAAAVIPSRLCADFLGDFVLSVNGKEKVKAAGQFAEKDFFNVFSYELTEGDQDQVLSNENSIVISEKLAQKLFDHPENAIGQTIEWQLANFKRQATISGVFKRIPANSTSQFEFVLDFEPWLDLSREVLDAEPNWDNQAPSTYLVLKAGTDVPKFNEKINHFIQSKIEDSNTALLAVQYSSQYLYGHYENGIQTGSRIRYVRLFSIIAIFILLIACINFMNLTTAKASGRMREIGIKKVIGAGRKSIILQCIGESVLMALISIILALLFTILFLPKFNEITAKQLTLGFEAPFVLLVISIVLITGILAGGYPALYLSGFNPVTMLKGKLTTPLGQLLTQKGLVVFQFVISIVLIVAVTIIYKQIGFIQSKNLGYNKDNIIYFAREGAIAERSEAFLSEVRNLSGVTYASAMSGNLTGAFASTYGVNWDEKEPDTQITFGNLSADYDLIEALEMEMVSGRDFSHEFGDENNKLIFNETAIKMMGFQNPVGKIVNLWGEDREIIGVVKDFHFESLHENVKPMFIKLDPDQTFKIVVRIQAGREKETIAAVEDIYQQFNPGYPFDFLFMDKNYQTLYASEQRVSILSQYFAGLAILISCLGLFGLAALSTERRIKEIGIRKVLGASVTSVVALLSRDFIKLILIAIIVATPIAWYAMNRWLQGFAYRIELQWWMFVGAGLMAVVIAMVTVSGQSIKAATANPIKSLRTE
ncbi:ABC transporter permease [Galbibacter sp. EGI 63066]|uniref:ABC transporter permease n=1 Tax=Galbibacter sp. EGI 63066 TaxID=2993559 RepID=UPI0022493311|nr:ABC transporter permease [Galbibacter sp. EGI 63066]MCX2681740.1 ABC transporter permease [Galbibacter sp. EGI 63066]